MVSFIHRLSALFSFFFIHSLRHLVTGTYHFSLRFCWLRYTYIQPRLPLSLKYFSAIKALLSISHPLPFSLLPRLLHFVPGINVRVRNGVSEAGCDVGFFLEGVCRCVGCRRAFQVKAFVRVPAGSVSGAVIYQLLLVFVFVFDSQVGNNNFLRRYMISA